MTATIWLRTGAQLAVALSVVAWVAAVVSADRRDHAVCLAATSLPCSAVVQVRR